MHRARRSAPTFFEFTATYFAKRLSSFSSADAIPTWILPRPKSEVRHLIAPHPERALQSALVVRGRLLHQLLDELREARLVPGVPSDDDLTDRPVLVDDHDVRDPHPSVPIVVRRLGGRAAGLRRAAVRDRHLERQCM